MPQVNATFPGIEQVTSAYGTRTLGPLPSTVIVNCLPQENLPALDGDFEFQHGDDKVTWKDCHVKYASMKLTKNGHVESFHVLDRRVWWEYTKVSGVYNERLPNGDILETVEKSPRELAELLLEAMEESEYDVSELPDDDNDRPFVEWSCTNPAYELHRLCQERGCEISLLNDDSVRIVRVGQGEELPNDGDVQSVAFGVETELQPEKVEVCMAETLYEVKLKLEPVGIDVDNLIVPIKELTYRPDPDSSIDGSWEGWATTPLDFKNGTWALDTTDQNVLYRANLSVYRWYRIKENSEGDLFFPSYSADDAIELESIEQILPLVPYLSESVEDPVSGELKRTPWKVEGSFNTQADESDPIDVTEDGTLVDQRSGAVLETDTGIVRFPKHMGRFTTEGSQNFNEPADLYLTCMFRIRDPETHAYLRHTKDREFGGKGTLVIKRDELQRVIRNEYNEDYPYDVENTVDNVDEVDEKADSILDQFEETLEPSQSYTVKYRGIRDLDTDGAIRQITWVIGKSGANTVASLNSEPEVGVLKAHETVRIAEIKKREQEKPTQSELLERWKAKRNGGLGSN